MICGIYGVELGTTLGERAGEITTGARAVLASTLVYGGTRRVEAVAAGTGVTVGVMVVVKRCKRLVREQSVLLPTV